MVYLKKIEFCGTCRTIICSELECNRLLDAVWYESIQYCDKIKISDVLFILKYEEKIKTIYFSVPRPGYLVYFSENPVCPIHVNGEMFTYRENHGGPLRRDIYDGRINPHGYSIILRRKLVCSA